MKIQAQRYYYVYVVTNRERTMMEAGLTADLQLSISQMEYTARKKQNQDLTDDHCCYLVYWERLTDINAALQREQEIKDCSWKKKQQLVQQKNPALAFLNEGLNQVLSVL